VSADRVRRVGTRAHAGGSRDLRQDMMGFLRRGLIQQAEVRTALYHGVYGVLLAGIVMFKSIDKMYQLNR
jgi:hypothetical protein